jgi:hypothetical protein
MISHPDHTVLRLIELLKTSKRIRSKSQFCDEIGFLKQNLLRVEQRKAHFSSVHIMNICKIYNVDANWIIGIAPEPFKGSKKILKTV